MDDLAEALEWARMCLDADGPAYEKPYWRTIINALATLPPPAQKAVPPKYKNLTAEEVLTVIDSHIADEPLAVKRMAQIRDYVVRTMTVQKAEVSVDEWRDIETAPKDGTVILAYVPTTMDYMRLVPLRWVYEQNYGKHLWIDGNEGGWGGVTHWQPLPAPPVSAQPIVKE